MYFEDIDLCRRLHEAGRTVRRDTTAGVIHSGGRSWDSAPEKRRRFHRSKLLYFQKLGITQVELLAVQITSGLRTRGRG